jgi:oxaloacetate decarboxylase gamma subunit
MISEGLNLAMFGMGVVFVFLVLLIYVTKFMSMVAQKLESNRAQNFVPIPPRARGRQPAAAGAVESARLKTILAEAVKQYKSSH